MSIVLARKIDGYWIFASKKRFKTHGAADKYRSTLTKKKGQIYIIPEQNYKIFKSLSEAMNWDLRRK